MAESCVRFKCKAAIVMSEVFPVIKPLKYFFAGTRAVDTKMIPLALANDLAITVIFLAAYDNNVPPSQYGVNVLRCFLSMLERCGTESSNSRWVKNL